MPEPSQCTYGALGLHTEAPRAPESYVSALSREHREPLRDSTGKICVGIATERRRLWAKGGRGVEPVDNPKSFGSL
jgi:hypothetical protein